MTEMKNLLAMMVEQGASDMVLSAGNKPYIKVNGIIRPAYAPYLQTGEIATLALEVMTPQQQQSFSQKHEANLALTVPDIGRFRLNFYYQRGEVSIAVRYIKSTIPSFGELGLPPQVEHLSMLKRGLVLITGMAGSGKSTTLAAMVTHRARHIFGHILTVEDPIEYLLPHSRSLIEQREIGFDTESFAEALKSAMREAVDVIVIGEIRDAETARQALTYADSGILCLATMHANSADQTVSRMLNFFPNDMHDQVLLDLSLSLQGVVSQRLLPSQGKLVLAAEVMVHSAYIADLIRDGRLDELKDAIRKSAEAGMQTLDESLFKLYQAGLITHDEAMQNADSEADMSVRIRLASWSAPLKLADQ